MCFFLVCLSVDFCWFCFCRLSVSFWNGRVRGFRDSKGSRGRRVGSGILEYFIDVEEFDEDV